MTKEELQKIIDQFDEEDLKRQGIFGISHHGEDFEESFIRANNDGLQLFALQLLKASRGNDENLADADKNIIQLGYHENWIDQNSDTFIQHIEPVGDKEILKPRTEHKQTFTEKLMTYGCLIIAIALIVALITGLVTIFKSLF